MTAERVWPMALAGALVATVLANVVLVVAAGRGGGAAVAPDYYRRAVAWDSTLADEARSRALGWTLAATLTAAAAAPAHGTLDIRLRDSTGAPLAGATVRVESFAVARSASRLALILGETTGGRYAAALPVRRVEWYEFAVTAERGAARFVARIRCLPDRRCRAA